MRNTNESDRLPAALPGKCRRESTRIAEFPGLAVGGLPRAGQLSDMRNLSPLAHPALAVRTPRALLAPSRGMGLPHGMALLGEALYLVQGTTLYRITSPIAAAKSATGATATAVGTVSDSDKRMAVFGGRLLILPDKLYVDSDGTLHPMELETGVIPQVVFDAGSVTLPEGQTWAALGFAAGDGLSVINADDDTPAPEGDYRIRSLRGRVATLTGGFSAPYTSDARFARRIPDLDGLCVSGDRVYGFAGDEILVSAAGSAFCWAGPVDDGSGAARLRASSAGAITACAPWQGYVVYFKADRIFRLLGSRADSFELSETPAPGVPAPLAGTLAEVGGALYYHGDAGVYRYTGHYPERVATLPGEVSDTVVGGLAGTDGAGYYLSLGRRAAGAPLPTWRLYLYDPARDTWYAEDSLRPVSTALLRAASGAESYLALQAAEGAIWLTRADGRVAGFALSEVPATGAPFATATFPADHAHEPEGYRPVTLTLRASAPAGASLKVLASFVAPGEDVTPPATELATFTGPMTDRTLRIPLCPSVCDAMTVGLEMSPGWVIHAVSREYERRGG